MHYAELIVCIAFAPPPYPPLLAKVPATGGIPLKTPPFPHVSRLQTIGFPASFAELAVPSGFGDAPM
jgi:hypothetical protein